MIQKITDDSFKLSNAGVGGTSMSDYNRGKYEDLLSTGEGFQIFNYPKKKLTLMYHMVLLSLVILL